MNRLDRILEGHFKKETSEVDEYVMHAKNIKQWYVLIRNLEGDNEEWRKGMFLFDLIAPDDFPMKPPSFRAKYKNGVYEVDSKCCISIGEYHSSDYKQVLGMPGFTRELANGMINHKFLTELGGINLLQTTDEEKRRYCEESIEHLQTDFKEAYDLLEESFEKYSSGWDLSQCNNEMRKRLSFGRVVFPMKEETASSATSTTTSAATSATSTSATTASTTTSNTSSGTTTASAVTTTPPAAPAPQQ